MLTVLQSISAVAAGIAAGFWLLSAVQVPGLIQSGAHGPNDISRLRKQSMLSAIAAVFAAVSAIAQVTNIYLSAPIEASSHTHALMSKHNGYHYYDYSRF
jgi:hypothetical protein